MSFQADQPIQGYIHSIETGGTVDGPGIRYVGFLQGCPLRCLYCHNPDSWKLRAGKIMNADDFFADVLRYKRFIRTGGLTLSGGEPLVQPEFVTRVFQLCRQEGIHTALDTSGIIPAQKVVSALEETDLVLLDIKSLDDGICRKLTGASNANTLGFLEWLEKNKKPVWIRHVVVPSYTDRLEDLEALGDFLQGYSVIQRVELLPFHQMALYKWENLRFPYLLKDLEPPDPALMEAGERLLRDRGIPV